MTRRLSTRTFVYALIVAFIILTVLALAFGLPFGGTSATEGHRPRL
jgi:hypothetical protein